MVNSVTEMAETAASSSRLSAGEILDQIVNTALVGYLLIFVVLALIWGIIVLFGKLATEKKEKTVDAAADTASNAPVGEVEQEDDCALVAAIAAAISCYTEKPLSAFRVVSFRRAGKK